MPYRSIIWLWMWIELISALYDRAEIGCQSNINAAKTIEMALAKKEHLIGFISGYQR